MNGNLGGNHLVNWTPEKLERFKKAYDDTKDFDRDHVFEFEGHAYVRSYSKYLIEHLESEFSKRK